MTEALIFLGLVVVLVVIAIGSIYDTQRLYRQAQQAMTCLYRDRGDGPRDDEDPENPL